MRKGIQYFIYFLGKEAFKVSKIREFYDKYNELILYIFFGFLTFLTDTVVFGILSLLINLDKSEIVLHVCSIFSALTAITFAYITNRKYVFKSKRYGKKAVLKELTEFFGARAFTMIIAEVLMQVMVFDMGIMEILSKIVVNIIVIILNYVFSKVFIFK